MKCWRRAVIGKTCFRESKRAGSWGGGSWAPLQLDRKTGREKKETAIGGIQKTLRTCGKSVRLLARNWKICLQNMYSTATNHSDPPISSLQAPEELSSHTFHPPFPSKVQNQQSVLTSMCKGLETQVKQKMPEKGKWERNSRKVYDGKINTGKTNIHREERGGKQRQDQPENKLEQKQWEKPRTGKKKKRMD